MTILMLFATQFDCLSILAWRPALPIWLGCRLRLSAAIAVSCGRQQAARNHAAHFMRVRVYPGEPQPHLLIHAKERDAARWRCRTRRWGFVVIALAIGESMLSSQATLPNFAPALLQIKFELAELWPGRESGFAEWMVMEILLIVAGQFERAAGTSDHIPSYFLTTHGPEKPGQVTAEQPQGHDS